MKPIEVTLQDGSIMTLYFRPCRHDFNCRLPWDLMYTHDTVVVPEFVRCFAHLTYSKETILQYMTLRVTQEVYNTNDRVMRTFTPN